MSQHEPMCISMPLCLLPEPATSLIFTVSGGVRRLSLDTAPDIQVETSLVTFPTFGAQATYAAIFAAENTSDSLVFISDQVNSVIYRAALDGSNVTTIAQGLRLASGIGVDHISQNLYFADRLAGELHVCRFDGSSRRTLATGLADPGNLVMWPERK